MVDGYTHDFFVSRRGPVSAVAQEVVDVLTEAGYRVFSQDHDIPLSSSFIEAMHEALKGARDLIVLLTDEPVNNDLHYDRSVSATFRLAIEAAAARCPGAETLASPKRH